jgi:hypothetical protein
VSGWHTSVDLAALDHSATQLLAASSDCRQLAGDVAAHAPDAGLPPAPETVAAVLLSTVDVLEGLGAALAESAGLLARAARRYEDTEREVVRGMREPATPADG